MTLVHQNSVNMNNGFKKFKKSGTYHRKLKLASEKYRLMYRNLHVEQKTLRNSTPYSAAKIVSDPTIGMRLSLCWIICIIQLKYGNFRSGPTRQLRGGPLSNR